MNATPPCSSPTGAPLTPVPEEMAHTPEPAANIPGTSAAPAHHADIAGIRHGAGPSGSNAGGARPSTVRGLWFGTAAAGMAALFAPYLFPLATGTVVVELADGGQATHQDWAISAQNLVSPLLLVGLLVLGWALVSLAVTPRRGPAAELEISGVEHPSEKP